MIAKITIFMDECQTNVLLFVEKLYQILQSLEFLIIAKKI
jgi:hypothetical protein